MNFKKQKSLFILLTLSVCLALQNDVKVDIKTSEIFMRCEEECLKTYESLLSKDVYEKIYYKDVLNIIDEVAEQSPDIIQVEDAIKRYDDQIKIDCGSEECKFPIVNITNFNSKKDIIAKRPQIFLIGSIHGNEIVGTHTLTYFIRYMHKTKHTTETKRILDNYNIVLQPMANPYGYYLQQREEKNHDPNRDFPYDTNGSCMFTTSGRVINHLFRENMFVSSITFHGGTNSISYGWGNYPHNNERISPDNKTLSTIGSYLSNLGSFNNNQGIMKYPYNEISKIVYPVSGGLEDYAYAGSVDKSLMKPCRGYEKMTSDYPENALRTAIYLIEADNAKMPHSKTLGTESDIITKSSKDGHVSRNIRISQGLVKISGINIFIDDISAVWENSKATPQSNGNIL